MPNEQDLKSLEQKLLEANVDHKMWIEQPENFPTCLAVRPYPKEQVQKYFKKFKLFKDWKKTILIVEATSVWSKYKENIELKKYKRLTWFNQNYLNTHIATSVWSLHKENIKKKLQKTNMF